MAGCLPPGAGTERGGRHRVLWAPKVIWVVVKIMVPFWIPIIIRHRIFRVLQRDHNFDNHPYP